MASKNNTSNTTKITRTNYDADFKSIVVKYALQTSNKAASDHFGINESNVRRWKRLSLKAELLENTIGRRTIAKKARVRRKGPGRSRKRRKKPTLSNPIMDQQESSDIDFLICSHRIGVFTNAQIMSNSPLSEMDAMTKKYRCIESLPPVYQELHTVVVPVSFCTLPLYIDELVEQFRNNYKNCDFVNAKRCLKKVMLFLAEAKVCCAQRALLKQPVEPLPQKDLYFRKELEDLSSSFKQLPYPLAIYLDCIGNTKEGKFTVTPVLAEMQGIPTGLAGAISCGPRQLYPLFRSLRYNGVKDEGYVELVKSISHSLPEIQWIEPPYDPSYLLVSFFSNKSKKTIRLTEGEIKTCQNLLDSLSTRYSMVPVNLLEGKGTMAQTVQTPDWDITDQFPYFCMSDVSVTDQKLGAIFGFSYTFGKEVQKSKYSGYLATAPCRGEVEPRLMLKSIFGSEQSN